LVHRLTAEELVIVEARGLKHEGAKRAKDAEHEGRAGALAPSLFAIFVLRGLRGASRLRVPDSTAANIGEAK
jgi:hypothetical protein